MNFAFVRSTVAASFVLLTCSPAALSAQLFGGGQPGEDTFSAGMLFGQLDPQTTYRDGGTFDSGTLFGVTGTWWGHRYLGVNAGLFFTETESVAPEGAVSIVSGQDPRQAMLHVDGLARYPLADGDTFTAFPYLALGVGWKRYEFSRVNGRTSWDLGWSYALGGEVRAGPEGRFGVRAEFRDMRSNFTRWGEDLTQSDRILLAGLMFNL